MVVIFILWVIICFRGRVVADCPGLFGRGDGSIRLGRELLCCILFISY